MFPQFAPSCTIYPGRPRVSFNAPPGYPVGFGVPYPVQQPFGISYPVQQPFGISYPVQQPFGISYPVQPPVGVPYDAYSGYAPNALISQTKHVSPDGTVRNVETRKAPNPSLRGTSVKTSDLVYPQQQFYVVQQPVFFNPNGW
jgi:hypothetical protein